MNLKTFVIMSCSFLIFSCGEDTRKATHQLYENFTHKMDSLEAVQDQLKEKQANVSEAHLDLKGQFADMEAADSTALQLLKEHQELLNAQEELLDSMSFAVHKKFAENYQKDALTDQQIIANIDSLRIKNDRIAQNLRRIEKELNRIKKDQSQLGAQLNNPEN